MFLIERPPIEGVIPDFLLGPVYDCPSLGFAEPGPLLALFEKFVSEWYDITFGPFAVLNI